MLRADMVGNAGAMVVYLGEPLFADKYPQRHTCFACTILGQEQVTRSS